MKTIPTCRAFIDEQFYISYTQNGAMSTKLCNDEDAHIMLETQGLSGILPSRKRNEVLQRDRAVRGGRDLWIAGPVDLVHPLVDPAPASSDERDDFR